MLASYHISSLILKSSQEKIETKIKRSISPQSTSHRYTTSFKIYRVQYTDAPLELLKINGVG